MIMDPTSKIDIFRSIISALTKEDRCKNKIEMCLKCGYEKDWRGLVGNRKSYLGLAVNTEVFRRVEEIRTFCRCTGI